MTNPVFKNMRKERLRYAIQREVDRQTVSMSRESEQLLVDRASAHLESFYADDDACNHAAERAERTINPVVAVLADRADGKHGISETLCRDFLARPTVFVFPWTTSEPD